MTKEWSIPELKAFDGGHIEDISSGLVFGLKDDDRSNRTEVVLQIKRYPNDENQLWIRKWWDGLDTGYFLLINVGSGSFLTKPIWPDANITIYITGTYLDNRYVYL